MQSSTSSTTWTTPLVPLSPCAKTDPRKLKVTAHVNGVKGDHNHDDSQASARTEEPSSSLDGSLPISVSKSAIKWRKKRARRKSLSRGPLDPPGTVTEVIVLPDGDALREEGASLVQRPAGLAVNSSGAHHPSVQQLTAGKNEGGIVLHAKVYNPARNFGTESL